MLCCLCCFTLWSSMHVWLLQVVPKRTHPATVSNFLTPSSRKVRHVIICPLQISRLFDLSQKLKSAVFWDIMPCSFITVYQCFKEPALSIITRTDEAGSRFLWNAAILLAEYMVSRSRKRQSSLNFLKICVGVFSVMFVMETMMCGGCFSVLTHWMSVDCFGIGVFPENCL